MTHLQPEEEIESVVLNINEAKIPVEMEGGRGEIIFSTESPGIISISAVEGDILSSRILVIAS
jgi:hypothetical protein